MVVQTVLFRFARDESGATAIEYALVAGGIALAVISAVNALGQTVKTNFFDLVADSF